MTMTKRGKKSKKQRREQKSLYFTCFLKGLRGDYSFSEVEREQADEMTENRIKIKKTF